MSNERKDAARMQQATEDMIRMRQPPSIAEMQAEITRLQAAKRAALKLADERAKEANELRQDRDKWHRVAMEAGAVTCVDGSHIFPLKQGK